MAKKARDAERSLEVVPPAREWLARLSGARLCYGKPVKAGERVVIPVASLRTVGGGGFSRGPDDRPPDGSTASGGGGALEARPIGFIEVGPDGSRFQAINEPHAQLRALAGGAVLLLALRRLATARRGVNGRLRLPPRARLRLPLPRR